MNQTICLLKCMIKCVDCVGLSDIKRFSLHVYIDCVISCNFFDKQCCFTTSDPISLNSKPEIRCKSGQFGLGCNHQCNCADQTESCFVHSGGCPSGCAPGFTGEDCSGWLGRVRVDFILMMQSIMFG